MKKSVLTPFFLLDVNGIAKIPLIYFSVIQTHDAKEVAELHRLSWNLGEAPLLFVVTPDKILVYNNYAAPQVDENGSLDPNAGIVDAAQLIRQAPVEETDPTVRGKAALTELFQSIRNENTPVIVERIVNDIDGIVKIVRFPGWQNTPTGRREVSKNLRDVIMRKYRVKDQDVFAKAYSYVEQYY